MHSDLFNKLLLFTTYNFYSLLGLESKYEEACSLDNDENLSIELIVYKLAISGCTCIKLRENYESLLNCNPFPLSHPPHVQIIFMFLIFCLFILSIAGNVTVIWIILWHERMRTVINYYILNLAISDLFVTLLNTGLSGTYNVFLYWPFSEGICAFNNFMGVAPVCASVFTMVAMSVDRYIAFVHPLCAHPTRSRTIGVIAGIWLFSIVCALPSIFGSGVGHFFFIDESINNTENSVLETWNCFSDQFSPNSERRWVINKIYQWVLLVIQYLIPLCILGFTYRRSASVLRCDRPLGDFCQGLNVKAKRKAANLLMIIFVAFILLWLPYNLYFIVLEEAHFIGDGTKQEVFMVFYLLGMSYTVVNPLMYYAMNNRFRVGFRYAFRWLPWVHVSREEYVAAFATRCSLFSKRPTFAFLDNNSKFSAQTQSSKSAPSMRAIHPIDEPL